MRVPQGYFSLGGQQDAWVVHRVAGRLLNDLLPFIRRSLADALAGALADALADASASVVALLASAPSENCAVASADPEGGTSRARLAPSRLPAGDASERPSREHRVSYGQA